MILSTTVPMIIANDQIGYSSRLLLLGSCFAENMGQKLAYFKFQHLVNPFGILFHPLAIETLVARALQKQAFTLPEVFCFEGSWHSFAAHSQLSDLTSAKLLQNLNGAIQATHDHIINATHIIITLGTGWVYRELDTNQVVANCHKLPQRHFSKELLGIDTIVASVQRTLALVLGANPNAKIIFTISPVRHLKDGFVENQRSKAHLITALHTVLDIEMGKGNRQVGYFPAYEIMVDELRDYRFYESDMVHPSTLAIDYIWDKFKHVWISKGAFQTLDEVENIQKGLNHRPFNRGSVKYEEFKKNLEAKIAYLQDNYPFMNF